jgi:hypothetical protein
VFITNPFLREWAGRTPAFDALFCDFLENVVRETTAHRIPGAAIRPAP